MEYVDGSRMESAGLAYDYKAHKVVAVLSSSLDAGVALNVVGHLALAVGAYAEPGLMGRNPLTDKSGIDHVGISRYPVIITKVKPGRLRRLVEESRELKDILLVDYPQQMLDTGHDDELAAEIGKAEEESLQYLGAILYGPREPVDSITGRFTLWQ